MIGHLSNTQLYVAIFFLKVSPHLYFDCDVTTKKNVDEDSARFTRLQSAFDDKMNEVYLLLYSVVIYMTKLFSSK